MSRDDEGTQPELTDLLLGGTVLAMLGIVLGVGLALYRLEEVADLWTLKPFTNALFAPLACGALAMLAAVAEVARIRRFHRQLFGVFGLGALAMATPFVIGVACVCAGVALALWLLSHAA